VKAILKDRAKMFVQERIDKEREREREDEYEGKKNN
jgi:hypothetical protein